MVLSGHNKQVIEELGNLIKANAEAWGADALARLFEIHPQAKTYFPKFNGYKASDPAVRKHGCLVMEAVADAAHNVDNLSKHLESLAKKHGEELLVDPHNFQLLADCIVITLAINLQAFTPATHCAVDKFLELLAHELSSKYR
ncbi:hemoglobin subunit alpha-like [Hypanus sabinus]|uniref:hemoglobin subunit alpha-like n=1 Tax=Hypanus sabinus TaxID=79690 RepID=UPI0028C3A64A|nr:hemoglobin subunit alpha-like [Hypanus sabinus]